MNRSSQDFHRRKSHSRNSTFTINIFYVFSLVIELFAFIFLSGAIMKVFLFQPGVLRLFSILFSKDSCYSILLTPSNRLVIICYYLLLPCYYWLLTCLLLSLFYFKSYRIGGDFTVRGSQLIRTWGLIKPYVGLNWTVCGGILLFYSVLSMGALFLPLMTHILPPLVYKKATFPPFAFLSHYIWYL